MQVVVSPVVTNVTIDDGSSPAVTVQIPSNEILSVITAGQKGYDGYDGSQIITGATAPAAGVGVLTDFYLNVSTGDVYLKQGTPTAAWVLQGNIKGAPGTIGIDGAAGKNYVCMITGGIRTIEYDKNGSNPAPVMVPFGAEMRENGNVIIPTCFWSTPASGSLLSGSSNTCSFTPAVAPTFSAAAADNRVDVTLTYNGVTCKATAPVPATKVGADGTPGSIDNKQQLYTKIAVGTNGDVLNTQPGSGDADSFAFRTTRSKSGDIHKADLAVGATYYYARPGDSPAAEKWGLKTSAGVTTSYFQSDGSLVIKGSLVIQ